MTLNTAKNYLKELLEQHPSKREIKVSKRFLKVLIALEKRKLSDGELDLINDELTRLELNKITSKRKAYLRKKLRSFLDFINSNFSLVVNEHYAQYGMSLGMTFGIAIGTGIFHNSNGSSIGLCIGLVIGYLIGLYMDKEAEKENRVLNLV